MSGNQDNSLEGKGPFIDIKVADASTETKWKTVFGELIDVIQFSIMTAFGEGIDAIAKYAYGIKHYLSGTAIAGLDTFSYLIMVWLASVRVDKYKQRNDLFDDKNEPEYYTHESSALLSAMTDEEKNKLFNGIIGNQLQINHLTTLLKHDAITLDPIYPHTQAKKRIKEAHLLFERIRKREEYVNTKFLRLCNALNIKSYTPPVGQAPSAKAILYWKISQDLSKPGIPFSLEAAENLIAELTLIEKHWKNTLGHYETDPDRKFWSFIDQQLHTIKQESYENKEFNHELRLNERIGKLFIQRGIMTKFNGDIECDKAALDAIKSFYKTFHSIKHLHDQNDQNYYKAQERGILEYERERTETKVKVFSWVRKMSLWAAPISIILFFAVWINSSAALASFIPLFMVGTTSLIDEAIDIRYKYQKWRQSVVAKKSWQVGTDIDILKKMKTLIDERDRVPESLSGYSPQELIFIHSIAQNDYYDNGTSSAHKRKFTNHRDTRRYLQEDIEKAMHLFPTSNSTNAQSNYKLIENYIEKIAQPLVCSKEFETFIDSNENEINEYRFYEEGYIAKSDQNSLEDMKDLKAAGMRYLEAQYKIYAEFESRAARRQTKLIQSCFSFNGVFWGVLASMAVHILLLSATVLSAPLAMNAFNYIGFITIGIAAVASGIMIRYQLNQNEVKAHQKNEEHYLHMNHIINPTLPTAPTAPECTGAEKEKLLAKSSKSSHCSGTSLVRFSNHQHINRRSEAEASQHQQIANMKKKAPGDIWAIPLFK